MCCLQVTTMEENSYSSYSIYHWSQYNSSSSFIWFISGFWFFILDHFASKGNHLREHWWDSHLPHHSTRPDSSSLASCTDCDFLLIGMINHILQLSQNNQRFNVTIGRRRWLRWRSTPYRSSLKPDMGFSTMLKGSPGAIALPSKGSWHLIFSVQSSRA